MKKTKTTSKKGRPQVVHAYQSNPYALQRRNATAAPPELVPIVVTPPPRRRRTAKVMQQAKKRLTDNQFLAETGLAAAGAAVGALATGWAAGKGWNPWAMGAATAVVGGAGALGLPGAWRGAGIGVAGWGVGQLVATMIQQHALHELQRQQKAKEQQQAVEQQQRAADQQRALDQATQAAQKALPPASKPSNAFMPSISDAFANARTYGHYGRADDEERMTDLDLVLG
jgi:hypothetical protein